MLKNPFVISRRAFISFVASSATSIMLVKVNQSIEVSSYYKKLDDEFIVVGGWVMLKDDLIR